MDWFTVLLVIVFFVFPLIQQLLEAKRRGAPIEDDNPEVDEPVRIRVPQPSEAPQPVLTAERDGWSSGWGSWPGESEKSGKAADAPAPAHQPTASPTRVVSIPNLTVFDDLHRPERDVATPLRQRRPQEIVQAPPIGRQSVTSLRIVRNRSSLRSAVVMSEVLGEPRALQDWTRQTSH